MFEFPNTFKREYTDYITKKPLGKFIQAHKLAISWMELLATLIEQIL